MHYFGYKYPRKIFEILGRYLRYFQIFRDIAKKKHEDLGLQENRYYPRQDRMWWNKRENLQRSL